ncbi:hypothetical protein B0H14DRAFT_2637261 [Mycena olivaceomarginata]|nr:hypothetical protein B0H14DRAFT_2637261 [Mycena olivaceomarginata]
MPGMILRQNVEVLDRGRGDLGHECQIRVIVVTVPQKEFLQMRQNHDIDFLPVAAHDRSVSLEPIWLNRTLFMKKLHPQEPFPGVGDRGGHTHSTLLRKPHRKMGKSTPAENVPESFGFGRQKNTAENTSEFSSKSGTVETDKFGVAGTAAESNGFSCTFDAAETNGLGNEGNAGENNSFAYRSGVTEVTAESYCFGLSRKRCWKLLFQPG